MLLEEQKSSYMEKKGTAKMTRKYSNQTYVQENKNFMYKLQKEIDP